MSDGTVNFVEILQSVKFNPNEANRDEKTRLTDILTN